MRAGEGKVKRNLRHKIKRCSMSNTAEIEIREEGHLGKTVPYDPYYNPERLFSVSRKATREELGIDPVKLPFHGFDYWNHYEVSWLDPKGKPVVALAEIVYECDSPNIIESKSMKLYFQSFNNTKFENSTVLEEVIKKDFKKVLGAQAHVRVISVDEKETVYQGFEGKNLDTLELECSVYHVEPQFLFTEENNVEEAVYSHLLKSNCLITHQPDWGSVQITYKGKKINHEGLLKYIVSYRNHNEFHEQCIERIFMDIMRHCSPEELTVHGRYTRRGGIDINPYRSTKKDFSFGKNQRLSRQ